MIAQKRLAFIKSFAVTLIILSLSLSLTQLEAQNNIPAPGLTQIKVTGGIIKGVSEKTGITYFKGIPFAAPPVGDLRWKAPQPVKSWNGIKECAAFEASPMQASPQPFAMWSEEYLIPKKPISEDCLYLNVWTGAQSPKEKRPVLVWIYGGGFTSGGSAAPIYDGEAMAKRGILFVSINYRVGIFGFFVHPELTQESANHASGNYGLMDQVAALQWVKKNIASFGGDPANVTIAGQSAGSMSVNCLVASPLGKGLFKKAIAESGANFVNGGFTPNTLALQEQAGLKMAQTLNVTSIKELRNISADTLLAIRGMFGPVIDGYVLPDAIANIFAQGKENNVGLLTGWNEDEGLVFGPKKNAAAFREDAAKEYGSDASTLLKYYPANTDDEAAASQMNLSRDMIFGVQNYTWANVASKQGGKVYVYRFTRTPPYADAKTNFGAFHTAEVPYAYGNLKFVNRPWEAADHRLANTMSSYWVNFITSGNPNGKGLPQWRRYVISTKKIMKLDVNAGAEEIPDAASLDFLHDKMSGSK